MQGLKLLFLCGVALSSVHKDLDPASAKMVNEMIDAVESGLETPSDNEGRALFVTVTLTNTQTNLLTATVTSTTTSTCVAISYTGTCDATTTTTTTTTTTAAPAGRALDGVIYYLDGTEVHIDDISPSKVI